MGKKSLIVLVNSYVFVEVNREKKTITLFVAVKNDRVIMKITIKAIKTIWMKWFWINVEINIENYFVFQKSSIEVCRKKRVQ